MDRIFVENGGLPIGTYVEHTWDGYGGLGRIVGYRPASPISPRRRLRQHFIGYLIDWIVAPECLSQKHHDWRKMPVISVRVASIVDVLAGIQTRAGAHGAHAARDKDSDD